MKTVIYDNPYVNPGAVPEIAKRFRNGEEVVLTDEDAEIVLGNPHFRLATDAMTPFQAQQQAQANAAKVKPQANTPPAAASIPPAPPPKSVEPEKPAEPAKPTE